MLKEKPPSRKHVKQQKEKQTHKYMAFCEHSLSELMTQEYNNTPVASVALLSLLAHLQNAQAAWLARQVSCGLCWC